MSYCKESHDPVFPERFHWEVFPVDNHFDRRAFFCGVCWLACGSLVLPAHPPLSPRPGSPSGSVDKLFQTQIVFSVLEGLWTACPCTLRRRSLSTTHSSSASEAPPSQPTTFSRRSPLKLSNTAIAFVRSCSDTRVLAEMGSIY